MNNNNFFPSKESFKKEIASKQELLLSHDKMLVNLELYSAKAREGAVGALKTPLNCSEKEEKNSQIYGLQGSFRKLEVD